jgi:F0F1-type ATP synthase beta subunit
MDGTEGIRNINKRLSTCFLFIFSCSIAQLNIYSAVDSLDPKFCILIAHITGDEHHKVATEVQQILQNSKPLQDTITLLAIYELSEENNSLPKVSLKVNVSCFNLSLLLMSLLVIGLTLACFKIL